MKRKFNYTPGPWTWDLRSAPVHSYLVSGDDALLEVTPECLPSEANARLISLAPEMIEALERSERWLRKALEARVHEGTALPRDLEVTLGLVSSLLDRARGES